MTVVYGRRRKRRRRIIRNQIAQKVHEVVMERGVDCTLDQCKQMATVIVNKKRQISRFRLSDDFEGDIANELQGIGNGELWEIFLEVWEEIKPIVFDLLKKALNWVIQLIPS